MKFSKRFNS